MNYLEEWGWSELWFKISERKVVPTTKSQIYALQTNSTNDFKRKKLQDQYSAWLKGRSKLSPTSVALLNAVYCKISISKLQHLHNFPTNYAGKVGVGTLKIIWAEITLALIHSFQNHQEVASVMRCFKKYWQNSKS